MKKLGIISLAALALAGAVASLMIQHQSQAKSRESVASLQQQNGLLTALITENEHLSNLVAEANSTPPDDHAAELDRLRREAEALKKQTNDLAIELARNREPQPSPPAPIRISHPPEYYEQLQQTAGSKAIEARDIGFAINDYASEHQGQFPSNFDQINSYLARENRSLSGTNHFEIVYQGSLDDVQGIPWGSVAVIREQQPWPGPDGRMVRIYGMMGGAGQTVESDDNFQSWEAQHVISPPKAGQSGR